MRGLLRNARGVRTLRVPEEGGWQARRRAGGAGGMVPLASFARGPLTLRARRAHDGASGMALDRRGIEPAAGIADDVSGRRA